MGGFLLAHSSEASSHSWLDLVLRVHGEVEYHASGKYCLTHGGQEGRPGRDKGHVSRECAQ